ncbi:hypothetical protein HDU91_003840, partial [Kappamyces sp. JEL0680]
ESFHSAVSGRFSASIPRPSGSLSLRRSLGQGSGEAPAPAHPDEEEELLDVQSDLFAERTDRLVAAKKLHRKASHGSLKSVDTVKAARDQ